MGSPGRTFRVFISSTFRDLAAERNALQEHVFPQLRDLCLARGACFQAIDLRWGVSDEAARDYRTMRICLEEIERCQQTTPRPNFIILLEEAPRAHPNATIIARFSRVTHESSVRFATMRTSRWLWQRMPALLHL